MRFPKPYFVNKTHEYRIQFRDWLNLIFPNPIELKAFLRNLYEPKKSHALGGFGYKDIEENILSYLEFGSDSLSLNLTRFVELLNSFSKILLKNSSKTLECRSLEIRQHYLRQLMPRSYRIDELFENLQIISNQILPWRETEEVQDIDILKKYSESKLIGFKSRDVDDKHLELIESTLKEDDVASDISDDENPMRDPKYFTHHGGVFIRQPYNPPVFFMGGYAEAAMQQEIPIWFSASGSSLRACALISGMTDPNTLRTPADYNNLNLYLNYLLLTHLQRSHLHTFAESYYSIQIYSKILEKDFKGAKEYALLGIQNPRLIFKHAVKDLSINATEEIFEFNIYRENGTEFKFNISPSALILKLSYCILN